MSSKVDKTFKRMTVSLKKFRERNEKKERDFHAAESGWPLSNNELLFPCCLSLVSWIISARHFWRSSLYVALKELWNSSIIATVAAMVIAAFSLSGETELCLFPAKAIQKYSHVSVVDFTICLQGVWFSLESRGYKPLQALTDSVKFSEIFNRWPIT